MTLIRIVEFDQEVLHAGQDEDTSVALATGGVRQLLCRLDEYGSPQVNAG